MKAVESLSNQDPLLDQQELRRFVRTFLDRQGRFTSLAATEGSPLYVIDRANLIEAARRFRAVFSTVLPKLRVYYAVKSNRHPLMATTLLTEGYGLDVSSGLELRDALSYGADDIMFSGPGKRHDELALAAKNTGRVTVLLDSIGELTKLEQIAGDAGTRIRAGVRLTTDDSGIWRKFGITLKRLASFLEVATTCRWIDLVGLQFHLSWNLTPEAHVRFIERLGAELSRLDKRHLDRITFIDIGGGFWPESGEWLQPAATPHGILRAAAGKPPTGGLIHFKRPASPLEDFATHISAALRKHIPDDMDYAVFLEPGRWVCNDAMHILLTVADVKSEGIVITDGGTNAVGWERFESDYFPVINLSRPSLHEHECLIAGSLCTPHDIWGYSYFGEAIREGDVLLIPNQGAYTYSLRQEFIKPLPRSVELPSGEPARNESAPAH